MKKIFISVVMVISAIAYRIKGILSNDIEVLLNNSAVLSCTPNEPVDIQWHFNTDVGFVYAGGIFRNKCQNRCNMNFDYSSGTYTMKIPNVRQEDAGLYMCSEEIRGNRISSTNLAVLHSNPVCHSNKNPDGFIRPTTCDLELEVMAFNCSVSFDGISPVLNWRTSKDGSILNSSNCDYGPNHVNCSLIIKSDSLVHGTEFICHTASSGTRFNCSSGIIKIPCYNKLLVILLPIFLVAIAVAFVAVSVFMYNRHRRATHAQSTDGESFRLVECIPKVNIKPHGKKSINGITVVQNSLFLVRHETPVIEVYNLSSNTFERQFPIHKITVPLDITSLKSCLYVIGRSRETEMSSRIAKINLEGHFYHQWKSGGRSGRLSASESSIIVCLYDKRMIYEYDRDGNCTRKVKLSNAQGFNNQRHAIKVFNGNFLVSFGDKKSDLSGVRKLHSSGTFVKDCTSWENHDENSNSYFKAPECLLWYKPDEILVADRDNRRLVSLDSNLQFKRVVLEPDKLPEDFYPVRLAMDEDGQRVLVAINSGSAKTFRGTQVLILDMTPFNRTPRPTVKNLLVRKQTNP